MSEKINAKKSYESIAGNTASEINEMDIRKTFSQREVGFNHPDNSSFIRLTDAGDIEIFATPGVGIVINGTTKTISFFADKTVTMGEGGVILTNNYKLYCKLKLVRNQGRPNSGTFIHPEFGMNFRVTDMQSAVGFAQLKKLEEKINKKNKLFKMYSNNLKDCKNIKIIEQPLYSNFVPFRFAFRSKKKKKNSTRLTKSWNTDAFLFLSTT